MEINIWPWFEEMIAINLGDKINFNCWYDSTSPNNYLFSRFLKETMIFINRLQFNMLEDQIFREGL
jgi:hypothetical protein